MILFLHNRYRVQGGEERAVDDLAWLVGAHLGEDVQIRFRDSVSDRATRAAAGLLAGGLAPDQVARAVRTTGARIVHAHNLNPAFGWRSLAAARQAGARVVLHLHQYRLVCAVGVCFRDGAQCTRCHGRNTLPGVIHNCRGSRAQALTYGAALSLWQRRLVGLADVIVAPSAFAARRLVELGAPVADVQVVANVVRTVAESPPPEPGAGALVVSRLSPEKGVDIAIRACALAGVDLTVAGDGPDEARLREVAAQVGGQTRFVGRVGDGEVAALRRRAALAVIPSRSAETFGLAAAEAMAAGRPVAASRIGALPELVPDGWLAAPGDAADLAATIRRVLGLPAAEAGALAIGRARAVAAPETVAAALRAVYDRAGG